MAVLYGLMFFYHRCFLFLSPQDLQAHLADRRETLPHDHYLGALYNPSPPKDLVTKSMQNMVRFHASLEFHREYLWNESTYPKSERYVIKSDSFPRSAKEVR